jgi:hypothetical protein
LFELSRYRGRRRRVFGPANFPAVRSREPVWGTSVDSIVVGPAAFVRLYRSTDPANPGVWLLPQQIVEDLLAQQIGDELDSVQIDARPPGEGVAGYSAFAAALKRTHESMR